MATRKPLFTNLFILLIHLGCFICTSKKPNLSQTQKTSSRIKLRPSKALYSSWSFIQKIFSFKPTNPNPSILSPSSSARSLRRSSAVSLVQPTIHNSDPPSKRTTGTNPESDISSDHQHFFPLRNDIYPCPVCGEIFQTPNFLEHHQSIKHAVSELIDGDSGKNIVRIIFNTGWTDKVKNPNIIRILKIHNSSKMLNKFEEYRDCVRTEAGKNGAVRGGDERCLADGNELLRFHCATFLCELGQNGNSTICNQQYCSVCGIIKSGFSHKMDGISTLSTSWRAHVAIPADIEEEFKFMHVKRAVLICRVIAGRVGYDPEVMDKDDPGYDSLVGRAGRIQTRLDEEDELLVFNPRAVLPCFVIVYTV